MYRVQVLLMNVVGGAVVIVWSFFCTFLLYVVLRKLKLHRVTIREEQLGNQIQMNQSNFNLGCPNSNISHPICILKRINNGFYSIYEDIID